MHDARRRRNSLLFVVSSMAVGGPQKSLLGLLERLDPQVHDVSLLVLDPYQDSFAGLVPDHVTVLQTPPIVTAATLPKGRTKWAIREIVTHMLLTGRWVRFVNLVGIVLRGLVTREPSQRLRQRAWAALAPALPGIRGSYDSAIGVLGLSTYALVDLVHAQHKYHWVRSDSRVLNRDESIEAQYFSHLTGALAVSQSCKDIFAEMYPSMRERTRVYKNDIPTSLQRPDPLTRWPDSESRSLKILTVTRLDPLKGLDLAVEACARLDEAGVPVSWVVLGGGPEELTLRQLVEDSGQDRRFHILGTVFDTSSYLDQADVYVHPSRAEGRSNAVEEARARGKAIIATAYPTVADQVLDGVDGIVCGLNGKDLAAAIAQIAADTRLRGRLGATAAASYVLEREDPNWLFSHMARGVVPEISR